MLPFGGDVGVAVQGFVGLQLRKPAPVARRKHPEGLTRPVQRGQQAGPGDISLGVPVDGVAFRMRAEIRIAGQRHTQAVRRARHHAECLQRVEAVVIDAAACQQLFAGQEVLVQVVKKLHARHARAGMQSDASAATEA
jgi:hypothetical protein